MNTKERIEFYREQYLHEQNRRDQITNRTLAIAGAAMTVIAALAITLATFKPDNVWVSLVALPACVALVYLISWFTRNIEKIVDLNETYQKMPSAKEFETFLDNKKIEILAEAQSNQVEIDPDIAQEKLDEAAEQFILAGFERCSENANINDVRSGLIGGCKMIHIVFALFMIAATICVKYFTPEPVHKVDVIQLHTEQKPDANKPKLSGQ